MGRVNYQGVKNDAGNSKRLSKCFRLGSWWSIDTIVLRLGNLKVWLLACQGAPLDNLWKCLRMSPCDQSGLGHAAWVASLPHASKLISLMHLWRRGLRALRLMSADSCFLCYIIPSLQPPLHDSWHYNGQSLTWQAHVTRIHALVDAQAGILEWIVETLSLQTVCVNGRPTLNTKRTLLKCQSTLTHMRPQLERLGDLTGDPPPPEW